MPFRIGTFRNQYADMSITLRRITLREIELDLVEPFRTSTGVRKARHVLLLEAEDADGVTAWSECVAFEDPGYLPETIVSARHVITHCIVPRLLGHPIEHPRNVHSMLGKSVDLGERGRTTEEMAVWAIAAEKKGE